jgi:hypothetical protein
LRALSSWRDVPAARCPGDVIIVAPGAADWFSAIESDLDYLVLRVDP